jgi:hypothetical protein
MEKLKMKTIKNLILVFALTATFAFADGHTNGGNRCETCTPPPCTENCGGFAAEEPEVITAGSTEEINEETSLIDYWSEVFFELIG